MTTIHDDREIPRGQTTLGQDRRRAGPRRQRGRPTARRHFTADDDPARSLGEHAAHHGRRLRGGNRGADSVEVLPFDIAIPGGFPA